VNVIATFAFARLSWLECVVTPLRDNDEALANEYRVFFEADQLKVVERAPTASERAASLCPRCGLNAIVATTEREKKRLGEIAYRLGPKTFEDVPGT
jgi:hypothetical protein